MNKINYCTSASQIRTHQWPRNREGRMRHLTNRWLAFSAPKLLHLTCFCHCLDTGSQSFYQPPERRADSETWEFEIRWQIEEKFKTQQCQHRVERESGKPAVSLGKKEAEFWRPMTGGDWYVKALYLAKKHGDHIYICKFCPSALMPRI